MIKLNALFIVISILVIHDGNTFNLSLKPNIILREPNVAGVGIPKVRSSYFGLSLNLKQNSILVGAPRAQSTLETQRNINETGAIYKCSFNKSASGNCSPFVFDALDNYDESNDQYTFNNEKKDYQWLGASMDGSASDTEKFVVCAPRLISDQSFKNSHYLMHGICFWTSNTSSSEPLNVRRIAPLRFRAKQQFKRNEDDTYFYYIYGEQGVNVHITENNEEILIGAPGIFGWKGSVIRYKIKPLVDVGGLSRRKRQIDLDTAEYGSDIPNPMLFNQEYDSYFGFAVASGYFDSAEKSKLLYVASAPRANLQFGGVYIFDIIDYSDNFTTSERSIKIYQTFSGQQFGEYFGYSLLTEDFDNDGLTDVAIGAPSNSKTGYHENGAVYIYKNLGNSMNFSLHAILRTEYEFNGKFGMTMSKIGDINQDGYKDLIIGSPFEENGVAYIYHGSSNGLSTKYSQRIISPQGGSSLNQIMFGHGLSKGADIDGNQYLDIAIGAPNAEAVYIYKAYPVIQINTTITPISQEIQITDKSFKFNVCWLYESTFPINFDVHFIATVKLDGQLGRAVFQDRKNEYEINSKITSDEQCIMLEAFITFSFADIFRPIELEMTHHVINNIPNSDNTEPSETQEFCETCVAVNPNEQKNVKNKIVFNTGCKNARCTADLKIRSSLENVQSLPYILGSGSSLIIVYNIENRGETAYLSQIRIKLPDLEVPFTKTPSNCKFSEATSKSNVMECDLKSPMFKGDKTSIKISIDTTMLNRDELVIKANVFSTGDELNEIDNEDEHIIRLAKFSDLEIFGHSTENHLILQKDIERMNISHIFEIRNNGPSNINQLDMLVLVPLSHYNSLTLKRENLIDINSISIQKTNNQSQSPNDGQKLNIETSLLNIGSEIMEKHDLDIVNRQALTKDFTEGRTRTSVENTDKNRSINDQILSILPSNRTVYFDCEDKDQNCLLGRFTLTNVKASNTPIFISINFTINMIKVASILSGKRDIFVIRTALEPELTFSKGSNIQVVKNQPYLVISKYNDNSTPFWIFMASIICGILFLILASYALFKFGFFQRGKRDELAKLKRQSEMLSYWVVPGDEEYCD